jgi:uncharacterized protein (TIGR02217 family)
MSFDSVRLPEDVERGALGGPGFKTTIVELVSGREKRNQDWTRSRGRWDIGYGMQTKTDFMRVLAFFYARRGRAIGFRFKDWSDYEVGPTPMQFATGDGAEDEFFLNKTYTDSGSFTFVREITRPVNGTVAIYVNDVLQTETTHYTINYETGEVDFTFNPTAGHTIKWTGEFDVPVRFDVDQLEIALQHYDAGEIPSIPIVELKE